MQNVWRSRWKNLVKRPEGLAKAMAGAASGRPKLQFALAHWSKGEAGQWERRTTLHATPEALLQAAAELGQDFVLVGKRYPFPQQADLLTSPAFADEALKVLQRAWPVYRYAFEQTEGR
jgi:hypothetical protein